MKFGALDVPRITTSGMTLGRDEQLGGGLGKEFVSSYVTSYGNAPDTERFSHCLCIASSLYPHRPCSTHCRTTQLLRFYPFHITQGYRHTGKFSTPAIPPFTNISNPPSR